MEVIFYTTGCRLNQIESESAARFFKDDGFSVSLTPVTAKSPADNGVFAVVVNTCAVTQKAEQKDRRIIRLLLEKCPEATVIVTGCYAQLSKDEIQKISPRVAVLKGLLKSRITEVSGLLRQEIENNNFDGEKFAEKLNNGLFAENGKLFRVSEDSFRLSTDSFLAHSRSSIKIQDGCNCACTYCTIHIARGNSVSLSAEEVLNRVKVLEKAGQSEVVFTTVNIGQYKSEYYGKSLNFTGLLELCLKATDRIRFRISSLYPEIINEDFCRVISDKRVRPHFHISVQSGSNSVLKRMGRLYSREEVIKACSLLKKTKENPFLACDIITGFPGETDEDFEQTMDLCRQCGFAWVHVFPFSERPGTPACTMKNKVTQSLRDERAKILGEWAAGSRKNYIESVSGKIFDGVLETIKNAPSLVTGSGSLIFHAVTENFLHCEIHTAADYKAPAQGSAVTLKILGPMEDQSKGGETDCLAEFV